MKFPITLVIHGGAGPDSDHIHENREGYEAGLRAALAAGFAVLEKGGSALDAVEKAINSMEDNPLFNAGRGGTLNSQGKVEMCASLMEGAQRKAGAIAVVRGIKNPITLARQVMEHSEHLYLGGQGAVDYARENGLALMPEDYFITPYQQKVFEEQREDEKKKSRKAVTQLGTVGAVALDKHGNLAAGTSTGGLEYRQPGRIADSSMIGVGTYCDNGSCAVSTTGDGEMLIQNVVAHQVTALVEYKGWSVEKAAHYIIHEKTAGQQADRGLIALDRNGKFTMTFHAERMHRGWMKEGEQRVAIYEADI